jgi:hypothetical protein
MANKKIDPKKIAKSKDRPSTGDGRTSTNRVNMADTNLPHRSSGGTRPVGRLRAILDVFRDGKHHRG